MQEVVSPDAHRPRPAGRLRQLARRARAAQPAPAEAACALLSAAALVLAFPDFDLWPLAWVALAPLFYAIARRPSPPRAFLLGWLTGTTFFYGSCYWLTYPMIHYADIPAWIAYPLLLPATVVGGLFPALCALALAVFCARWGPRALWLAPFAWVALEWARLGVIGQLWNAVGYSQAYVPQLIQSARFGGVYAVGFLVLSVNAAVAYALARRGARAAAAGAAAVACVALALLFFNLTAPPPAGGGPRAIVVAVQPNVIPDFKRPPAETAALKERHFALSAGALASLDAASGGAPAGSVDAAALPRIVIWPESPMNFAHARDAQFREEVARFARAHRASLIFNSLEPAPDDGFYNAAVYVNEEGRLSSQYDKIRLMPFGEYVPIPRWLPGAGAVRGIVGEFTPGARYTLVPLGGGGEDAVRAGVFICIESAYPYISGEFARGGADVLINITNDAYQGDTAVMRQHLANTVFRAVETGRPLLRVTNTGITARVTPRGEVLDATAKFRPEVRVWAVTRSGGGRTFYTRFGDAFAAACAVVSFLGLLRARAGLKAAR